MQDYQTPSRPPRRLRRALVRGLLMLVIAGVYLGITLGVLSVLPSEFVPLALGVFILAPFIVITILNARRGGWHR
jgi:hypothetical protein